jgi:hypothetical protein
MKRVVLKLEDSILEMLDITWGAFWEILNCLML